MGKQIGWQATSGQVAALEERVHLLEGRVRLLEEQLRVTAGAIGVLARGLEDLPTSGPGGKPAAQAARQAHELLLAGVPGLGPQSGAAHG